MQHGWVHCGIEFVLGIVKESRFSRTQMLMILVLCLHANIGSSIELIPDSNVKQIDPQFLENKTDQFIRYARNEILARHGFPFTDPDLALYFQHQDWYREGNEEMELSMLEKENIAVLQESDQQSRAYAPEIIKRMNVNGQPVFLVTNISDKGNQIGCFYVLSRKDLWALECGSIPPEAIGQMAIAITKLKERDRIYPFLRSDQVRMIDLNEPCITNSKNQLLVESDVDIQGMTLFGFLDGLFQELFSFGGYLKQWNCMPGNTVELDMSSVSDLLGTVNSNKSCLLDLNTGQYWIAESPVLRFEAVSMGKGEIVYYSTKEGASSQDEEDIAGMLLPGKTLHFWKYYAGINGESVYFTGQGTSGWICYAEALKWGNWTYAE